MSAFDQELFDRALAGDGEAQTEIHLRTKLLARHVALALSRDPEIAEEVVQQLHLVLFAQRALSRYDASRARFETWIRGVARKLTLQELRKRGRAQGPDPSVAEGRTAEEVDEASRAHRIKRVREAILQLDPIYQEVVVLIYLEGLRSKEAAEFLDLPEGTIHARSHRARAKLRKLLRDLDD